MYRLRYYTYLKNSFHKQGRKKGGHILKRSNLTFIVGCIIIFILIIVMVFPQGFTDINPYGIQTIKKWSDDNGKFSLAAPPFEPAKDAPWGTDRIGRDIQSLIIYGTRLTILVSLLVVAGRFIIAIPLGLISGFGNYAATALINQFNVIFSALPALLIGVIILKMNFFVNLYKGQSIIAFVIVLTFIGWAKLGSIIMNRVQEILAKPFIKGEIAIGKSRFQIAFGNVLPHLVAELTVLFFMEIARVLTMMMQFGIFGVFIGNLRIVESNEGGILAFMNISFEPEWASMLGTGKDYIRTAPWTVLYPGMAFFISILGFNMFGEGLRKILQQKDSRLLSIIRRIIISDVLGKGRTFKTNRISKKSWTLMACFSIIAVSLIFSSTIISLKHQRFSISDPVLSHSYLDEEQVLIGTPEAAETATFIAEAMKGFGLKPLDKKGFISEYIIEDLYYPIDKYFVVSDKSSVKKTFVEGVDYAISSFNNIDVQGALLDATSMDLLGFDEYSWLKGRLVLMDTNFYSKPSVEYLIDKIMSESGAKGIICILKEEEELSFSVGKDLHEGAVVWVTREIGKELIKLDEPEIHMRFKNRKLDRIGRNVIGILQGHDEKVGEEAIIVGMGYNYDLGEKEIGNQKILLGLEIMKRISQSDEIRNRAIIFAFWDGSLSGAYNGIMKYSENPLYPSVKSILYIDLTNIESETADYLDFNSDQAPLTRFFAFSFSHQLGESFQKKKVLLESYEVDMNLRNREQNSVDKAMYFRSGIPTVNLSMGQENDETQKDTINLDIVGEVLVQTILKNNY